MLQRKIKCSVILFRNDCFSFESLISGNTDYCRLIAANEKVQHENMTGDNQSLVENPELQGEIKIRPTSTISHD